MQDFKFTATTSGRFSTEENPLPHYWEQKLDKIKAIIEMAEEWAADQENGMTEPQVCMAALKDIRQVLIGDK